MATVRDLNLEVEEENVEELLEIHNSELTTEELKKIVYQQCGGKKREVSSKGKDKENKRNYDS